VLSAVTAVFFFVIFHWFSAGIAGRFFDKDLLFTARFTDMLSFVQQFFCT